MTELHRVLRDGGIMTDPMSHDDCWKWLHKHQNMSVDWAMKYEGWTIEPLGECEKLSLSDREYSALSEFMEWLEEQGIQLAANQLVTDTVDTQSWLSMKAEPKWEDVEFTKFMPVREKGSDMIYRFLGIDQRKLEEERRTLLDGLGNM